MVQEAERKAEMKLSKDEEAKARGDDRWMLPELDSKLKKKKKKKKKKKSKSSDSEDEWVESGKNKSVPGLAEEKDEKHRAPELPKRDDWMEMGQIATYSRGDNLSKSEKRKKEKEEKEAANAPGRSSRELNPYFSGGGTGMPETEVEKKPTQAVKGDGGVAWLLKAFKRAEEQAKEENVPIEVIAEKRWGSLKKFQEMLAKAKEKGGMVDEGRKQGRDRRDIGSVKDWRTRSRSRERTSRRERSSSRERKNTNGDGKRTRSRSRERVRDSSSSRSEDRRKERSRSRERRRDRSRSNERRREKRKDRSSSRSPGRKFAKPGEKIDNSSKSANRSVRFTVK